MQAFRILPEFVCITINFSRPRSYIRDLNCFLYTCIHYLGCILRFFSNFSREKPVWNGGRHNPRQKDGAKYARCGASRRVRVPPEGESRAVDRWFNWLSIIDNWLLGWDCSPSLHFPSPSSLLRLLLRRGFGECKASYGRLWSEPYETGENTRNFVSDSITYGRRETC